MKRTATIDYYGKPARLTAVATLHAIGEQAPYFSLTGDVTYPRRRDCEECGSIHERILAQWPDLADVAALHLSSMDGVPMHAEENGRYWLAGYLGVPQAYGPSDESSAECLRLFAAHVRLPLDDASRLASGVVRDTVRGLDDPTGLRASWGARCRGMVARWNREAQAAIEHHGLTVTR